MDDKTLNSIKTKYEKIKQKRLELKIKRERIKYLEKQEIIKEYLKLQEETKKIYSSNELYLTDEELFRRIINTYDLIIKETNEIYLYMGTNKKEGKEYKIYKDIEKPCKEILIKIEDSEEFEENKVVIFLDRGLPKYEIYKIQEEFIKYAMDTTQENAKEKILKKYKP